MHPELDKLSAIKALRLYVDHARLLYRLACLDGRIAKLEGATPSTTRAATAGQGRAVDEGAAAGGVRMTVLAQPLSRPGPSFPATLNVSRLSAARPRHDPNAEPAPINPNFIASAQPAFAASEVAPDDYLRLYGRHGSRGSSAPDQPKSERQTTRWVVDMIAGKRFAWTARSAAAKLHMDEQWLRNRLRHGPVCHAGPPPVRLDWSARHVPPAPTETECTDEIE